MPVEPHDVRLPLIATERELIEVAQLPRRGRRVRLLFLGDVVGRSGRKAVTALLPGLIAKHRFDFVVVNGENAAGGFGITEEILQELLAAGADCVTTGNHVWDQREALIFADRYDRFLRPINYPPGTPGRGANVYTARNGARVLVVNVMGTLFMPALDDPFQAVTRELSACSHRQRLRRRDRRHARRGVEREADDGLFPRRQGLARHRHAHACADRRLEDPSRRHRLHDRRRHVRRLRFRSSAWRRTSRSGARRPRSPRGAWRRRSAPGALSGLAVEIDDRTGLARRVAPLRIGPGLPPAEPDFGDAA